VGAPPIRRWAGTFTRNASIRLPHKFAVQIKYDPVMSRLPFGCLAYTPSLPIPPDELVGRAVQADAGDFVLYGGTACVAAARVLLRRRSIVFRVLMGDVIELHDVPVGVAMKDRTLGDRRFKVPTDRRIRKGVVIVGPEHIAVPHV